MYDDSCLLLSFGVLVVASMKDGIITFVALLGTAVEKQVYLLHPSTFFVRHYPKLLIRIPAMQRNC